MPSTIIITKDQIDDLISKSVRTDTKMGEKTTVVCLRLPNGFEVIESSGCVDPANYNHQLGVQTCMRRIIDKVWLLEGYHLQAEVAKGPQNLITTAKLCHEVNRAYCHSIGDTTQVPWEKAEGWQRESAIKGVQFALANPDATPERQHESWMIAKVNDGWTYGAVKDATSKTHPCMVPYDALPMAQKVKDYLFQAVVRSIRL